MCSKKSISHLALVCCAAFISASVIPQAQSQSIENERIKRSKDCSSDDAKDFIDNTAKELLQKIHEQRKNQKKQASDKNLEQERTQQKKYKDKYKAILQKAFAYDALARSLIGPYWRKMSATQKEKYKNLIGQILEATISNSIYTLPVLDYSLVKSTPLGHDFAVQLLVRLENESDEVPLVWRVRCFQSKNEQKSMGIVDLIFRNISVIAGKRAEMTNLVRKQGIGQFLTSLEQELASLLAH